MTDGAMEAVFQLVHIGDGRRSASLKSTPVEFAKLMNDTMTPEVLDETVVLVLMDMAKGEWDYSTAPMLFAVNFISYFGGSDHG